jgi:NADPH2:quinone reductase
MHGTVMFKATVQEMQTCASDINRWLATGQLKAKIARVLPLSEAAAAHKLQEDNTLHKAGTIGGKLVLKP